MTARPGRAGPGRARLKVFTCSTTPNEPRVSAGSARSPKGSRSKGAAPSPQLEQASAGGCSASTHNHKHEQRSARTHLWASRALWRFSLRPWRRLRASLQRRYRSDGRNFWESTKKRKLEFLLLPHKTQGRRKSHPLRTDSPAGQSQAGSP